MNEIDAKKEEKTTSLLFYAYFRTKILFLGRNTFLKAINMLI